MQPTIVADSRRLTGPSLLLDRPGAVLEVRLEDGKRDPAIATWRTAARRLLDAVGWPDERLAVRTFAGGASLALTAPADALYAATDLNEAAWEAADAALDARAAEPESAVTARLRQAIADERDPALVVLRDAARARGLTFLAGEDLVSAGSGRAGRGRSMARAGASGRNWITCFQLRVIASAKSSNRSPGCASRSAVSVAICSSGITRIRSAGTPAASMASRSRSGTSSGPRPRR